MSAVTSGRGTDLDATIARSSRSRFFGRDRGRLIEPESADAVDDELKPPKDMSKLGTFNGVFIPTTLNVLSILMFLRFGFIIGQAGILGTMALLLLSYCIGLLTTLSISAISTNGTVKGGGAYYMISRSLGPEFGGSIGVVFFIGQVLNTGLNLVGFFEPIISRFGQSQGEVSNVLPDSSEWKLLYSTLLLIICTAVSSVGSSFFAKSSNVLFVVLIISVLSIPISVFFVPPYVDQKHDLALYTGLSWATIRDNLLPKFTKGAAGSEIKGRETFRDMFGLLFPATSGIFAGASMSGDLRKPSKSIPKGTLWSLLSTFTLYLLVILAIGSTASRDLLHKDIQVIQNINMSPYLVLTGALTTSLFSALMGIVGSAKLLQAIARDDLLPGLEVFAQGTKNGDTPVNAIALTFVLCQLTLFFDINQIAVYITMAYLMTFVVTNLACFLLKLASAPNFRPSFRYFNSTTAGIGAFASVVAMFAADGGTALVMIVVLAVLFLLIHYISPPKPWGDVSQTLIYHQVRKYLLRLRQDHVKFWRPQILLLIDDPRTGWSLMQFCNHLKKGGLYILGHVVITRDFQESYPELKRQQDAWNKLRAVSNVKGFVQIAAGPDVVWGARNVYIGSGLGGMKPNITVLGFYEKTNHSGSKRLSPGVYREKLPTDSCRKEPPITVTQWVHIIEDLLTMQANVAIAKGFPRLELPSETLPQNLSDKRGYIDLYPIQMTAQIVGEDGEVSALTTNFDTYTLILQMGAILRTVPAWKKNHDLRVIVFVEFQEDVAKERTRIRMLLEKLRIKAEILVLCLCCGAFPTYETIIHGAEDSSGRVSKVLGVEEWWTQLQAARETSDSEMVLDELIPKENSPHIDVINARRKRRHTLSGLQRLGVSFSIQTNNITRDDLRNATSGYYDDFDSDNDIAVDDDDASSTLWKTQLDASQQQDAVSPQPSNVSEVSQPDYFTAGFMYRRTSTGASPYPGIAQPPAARPEQLPVPQRTTAEARLPTRHHVRTPSGLSKIAQVNDGNNQPSTTVTAAGLRPGFQRSASGNVPQRPSALRRVTSEASLKKQQLKHSSSSSKFSESPRPALGPRQPSLIESLSRTGSFADLTKAKNLKPNFSGLTMPATKMLDNEPEAEGRRTIMFEATPVKSPHLPPSTSPKIRFDETEPLLQRSAIGKTYAATEEDQSAGENGYLSFNDLPAKAQHVILNDIMRSTSSEAAVIFSTLPAPALGTHKSEKESLDYVESLETWCEDLPPIVLLHSQSMTVTTAL